MRRIVAALFPLLILVGASCGADGDPESAEPAEPDAGHVAALPISPDDRDNPALVRIPSCMRECTRTCIDDPYCSHNCRCICYPPPPPARCLLW